MGTKTARKSDSVQAAPPKVATEVLSAPKPRRRKLSYIDEFGFEVLGSRPTESPNAMALIEAAKEAMKDVTKEDRARLPHDGSINFEHYIYGLPKSSE